MPSPPKNTSAKERKLINYKSLSKTKTTTTAAQDR